MSKLIAFTNSGMNDLLNERISVFPSITPSIGAGAANGYVAVPKDHPFYGKHYDDIPVSVHGGLTFSSLVSSKWLEMAEPIEGNLADVENMWVLGFDTCHCMDSLETWPIERVIEETLNLKQQLEEVYV